MAMNEIQAKAQRIRRELLPSLDTIAKDNEIYDEVNLICTRAGTMELTIARRTGGEMLPLFSADEIADDSYKAQFVPRVTRLLKEMR